MGWLHRIKYRLIAAFAVPLLVLCVVGAVAYRSTTTLEENSGKVSHTYQVLEALDVVTSTLQDAETGQRGYLITGEDRYLAPYESAKQSIDGAITAVEEQTATTSEMARNISDASGSSRDISGSLTAVAGAATETSTAIAGTRTAVNELATMSATLHTLVSQFKY